MPDRCGYVDKLKWEDERYPMTAEEYTELADRCVAIIDRNWLWVDTLIMAQLRAKLTKREAIHVARLALEQMEAE